MNSLSPDKLKERDELVAEYARLTVMAAESLILMPVRTTPDWKLFYSAHEKISILVAKIKEINDA